MNTNTSILKIVDLYCGYKDRIILKGIDFELFKGEFITILGPNGVGKTTLFRAINGSLKKRSGDIFLLQKKIEHYNKKEISKIISLVTQNEYSLDMKVIDFVLLGRLPYYEKFQIFEREEDINIAEECMFYTDTYKFKDRYLNELSSGERQLVRIAKALTQRPLLLLLDEPVSHLDVRHQIMLLDLLKKLNKELNISILTILHDINLASEYSDKILFLNEGRAIKYGEVKDVIEEDLIRSIYNIDIKIFINPITKKPHLFYSSTFLKGVKSEKRKN